MSQSLLRFRLFVKESPGGGIELDQELQGGVQLALALFQPSVPVLIDRVLLLLEPPGLDQKPDNFIFVLILGHGNLPSLLHHHHDRERDRAALREGIGAVLKGRA